MRLFDALIRLALVITIAVPPALAENQDNLRFDGSSDDDSADVRMDFIPLRLPGFDSDVAHRMVVVIDGELFGTELAGRIIRRNENRIGLDGVPFLEGVTRFSYDSDMFTAQSFAGSAGLIADTLILNIGVAPEKQPWLEQETALRLAAALAHTPMIQSPEAGQLNVGTVVTLNDDYSYALGGGLIRKLDERPTQVPVLGNIPIVGRLFTTTNTDNNTTELVVVISPSIIVD